ncbi:MAG: hypothetical protein V1777_04985 [Candidatus Micrarchaeota archaeon]
MPSVQSVLKWAGVALCSLLLLVSLVGLGFVFPVNDAASDSAFWKSAIQKADLYSLAKNQLVNQMVNSPNFLLSVEKQRQMVESAFSRPWFEAQTDLLLDKYFDFINQKTDSFKLEISLAEPKAKLVSEIKNLGAGQGLPADISGIVAGQIPDSFDLASQVEQSGSQTPWVLHRQAVVLANQMVWVFVFSALIWVALIGLLLKNRRAFAVIGTVFLLAGTLVLVVTQVVFSFSKNAFFSDANQSELHSLVQPLFQGVMEEFSQKTFFWAELWIGLGLLCWIIFILLKIRTVKSAVPQKELA